MANLTFPNMPDVVHLAQRHQLGAVLTSHVRKPYVRTKDSSRSKLLSNAAILLIFLCIPTMMFGGYFGFFSYTIRGDPGPLVLAGAAMVSLPLLLIGHRLTQVRCRDWLFTCTSGIMWVQQAVKSSQVLTVKAIRWGQILSGWKEERRQSFGLTYQATPLEKSHLTIESRSRKEKETFSDFPLLIATIEDRVGKQLGPKPETDKG